MKAPWRYRENKEPAEVINYLGGFVTFIGAVCDD